MTPAHGGVEPPRPVAVACCGCMSLLGPEGERIAPAEPGHLDIANLMSKAGIFTNREDADAAALKAGWTVADDIGPGNHRCPQCRKRKPDPFPGAVERRGMYVPIPSGGER